MKKTLILIFIFFISNIIYSQVGINTDLPDFSSVLEVASEEKGILIPRMTNEEKNDISLPAEGLIVFDTDQHCISLFTYLPWSGQNGWTCMGDYTEKFFYMPSVNIDTRELNPIGPKKELDLYAYYKSKFQTNTASSEFSILLSTFNRNQLNYYVTYYDNKVIDEIEIGDDGVMKYRIKDYAKFDSYMNIVFAVK